MEQNNNYGIVYVLTNPRMPELVKIGMTTRDSIDVRMKELYGTGVPVPFDCAYACKVKSSDCVKIEKALHKAFKPNRINENREFFEIKPEQAMAILELFNQEDITKEVTLEIDTNLTTEDKIASEKVKSARRTPRPPLNYMEMGILPNSVLQYIKDPSIEVIVFDSKKVRYNGKEDSLTAVTKVILGLDYSVQPTRHWSYNGRNLQEIYYETYILEE